MISDGQVGQSIMYNDLDLMGKITKNGTALVNYSYLVDGTKLSALQDSGEGLVYRGPFVYRKSTGPVNSSLTLESASFGGGRLTPSGAMLYVTDYLGSVRAVVDGQSGELYKASDYSAFGEENDVVVPQHAVIPTTQLATATLPDGTTIRDSYTGKEDQSLDFGTGYIDFGARQYNPSLRRWMTPDPLSEKYYGISPYAFCNNNPVRYVDVDGQDWFDKVVGYVVGFITNLIPGTGQFRDEYSPNDSSDYNNSLRDTDLAMFAIGEGLTNTGGAMMVSGGALAVAGASMTVASAGTAVVVSGPVAVVGADVAVAGTLTAGAGVMMMANSTANQGQGYDRGKSNVSNGNKNSQHANPKAKASAAEKYEAAKQQYEDMRHKPNKTQEDKRLETSYKKQMEHWKGKMDFQGENHSRIVKGNK